mmetsp:Transcript_87103/g.130624  ORF Transcript_87103/g.130624 Transcript_87103/m.130624 type:complete len:221 (-) Transcript_87103:747-1409(-)
MCWSGLHALLFRRLWQPVLLHWEQQTSWKVRPSRALETRSLLYLWCFLMTYRLPKARQLLPRRHPLLLRHFASVLLSISLTMSHPTLIPKSAPERYRLLSHLYAEYAYHLRPEGSGSSSCVLLRLMPPRMMLQAELVPYVLWLVRSLPVSLGHLDPSFLPLIRLRFLCFFLLCCTGALSWMTSMLPRQRRCDSSSDLQYPWHRQFFRLPRSGRRQHYRRL